MLRVVRRGVLVFFGVPFVIAVAMSVVDSYRRRGKKPKPFPTSGPSEVEVGGGTVTTYTFGQDLYDDMLAAIDGARKQVLFETYIWKGDEIGERFKTALIRAAERGVEVYCIYDGFANLVVAPRFKRFGPRLKVLQYPVYSAGWAFFCGANGLPICSGSQMAKHVSPAQHSKRPLSSGRSPSVST